MNIFSARVKLAKVFEDIHIKVYSYGVKYLSNYHQTIFHKIIYDISTEKVYYYKDKNDNISNENINLLLIEIIDFYNNILDDDDDELKDEINIFVSSKIIS